MNRIDQLDGLRGLAALLVFFSHAGIHNLMITHRGTGQVGVMLFFVLSGFLMGWLYGRQPRSLRSWGDYGARRLFRVYPLFVLVVVVSWLIYPIAYTVTDDNVLAHLMLQAGSQVLWTIPVEMKFYMVFPLLAPAVAAMAGLGPRLVFLGALIGFFWTADLAADKTDVWPYISFFLTGYVIAVLMDAPLLARIRESRWVDAGFLLGLVALFVSLPQVSKSLFGAHLHLWNAPVRFSLLIGVVLLLTLLSTRAAPLIFANRFARFFGNISFSLYLCHMPLIIWVKREVPGPYQWPVLVVAVVGLSYLLWVSVERPSQELGRRLGRRLRGERPVQRGLDPVRA